MDAGARGTRRAITATGRSYSARGLNLRALGRSRSLPRAREVNIVCSSKETTGSPRLKTSPVTLESSRGFGLKYEPRTFQDIVGHEVVVQAISNAAKQKRVAGMYLFHGPSGTGKTSLAKVFGMALNCESDISRPCWLCDGCSRSQHIIDFFIRSKVAGFKKISTIIKTREFKASVQGLNLFIVEDCHSLTAEAWDELREILEGSNSSSLVFVLICTDVNVVPPTMLSRCQKYLFPKLKDVDIMVKLARIVQEQSICIKSDALSLIAAKAQGSLREAENILHQVALLGPKISSFTVQQLVGLASHDKLTELLENAILKDPSKASKSANELIEAGVAPEVLVSQLTSLVTDLLLSSSELSLSSSSSAETSNQNFQSSTRTLSNIKPDKLIGILKILVEMKKQFNTSTNHTLLIVAAFFQIASANLLKPVTTNSVLPVEKLDADLQTHKESLGKIGRSRHLSHYIPDVDAVDLIATDESSKSRGKALQSEPQLTDMSDMDELWQSILRRMEANDVKEFLCHKVQLASLTICRANAIVHLTIRRHKDQLAAQKSEDRIADTLEGALGCPVALNISLDPTGWDTAACEDVISSTRSQRSVSNNSRHQRSRSFHSEPSSVHIKDNHVSAADQIVESVNPKLRKSRSKAAEHAYSWDMEANHEASTRQQLGSLLEQLKAENEPNSVEDSEMPFAASVNEESAAQTRSNRARRRWLSLSSNLQSDASIEPYSRDIVFDNVITGRAINTKSNRKIRKGIPYPVEENSSPAKAISKGLCQSWSCI